MRMDESETDLNESEAMKSALRRVLLNEDGGQTDLGSAERAQPEPAGPRYPMDADPNRVVRRVADDGEFDGDIDPMQSETNGAPPRQPLTPQAADPAAIRAKMFANQPQARAQPAPAAAPGESFDWKRGVLALSGGQGAVSNLDNQRAQQAQQLIAKSREQRDAAASDFSLDEQKKRSALAQAASDVASPVSQKMRAEMAGELQMMGQAMGTDVSRHVKALDGMSATDMLSMRQNMMPIFNLLQKAQASKATQAMADKKFDQGERQIKATSDARSDALTVRKDDIAEKRIEREDAKNEKAIDQYGKEVAPLDAQEELLKGVQESSKDIRTGPILARLHKVRQLLGIPNTNWDTAEGRLAAAKNEIRHAIMGGAITPFEGSEFEKELPSMDTPHATFDIKLATQLEKLALKKQASGQRHPRALKAGAGAPLKPSAVKQSPPGAKPGERYPNTVDGKVYEVQADGTMKAVQ